MSDVTLLLDAAAAGDRRAAADLLPLVYDELRKLAAARMAAAGPGFFSERFCFVCRHSLSNAPTRLRTISVPRSSWGTT